MAHAMPPYNLYGTLPTKIVFTKQKLRPPRGALRGGGKHLKGGMEASAPIITSNDFYRAKKGKNGSVARNCAACRRLYRPLVDP